MNLFNELSPAERERVVLQTVTTKSLTDPIESNALVTFTFDGSFEDFASKLRKNIAKTRHNVWGELSDVLTGSKNVFDGMQLDRAHSLVIVNQRLVMIEAINTRTGTSAGCRVHLSVKRIREEVDKIIQPLDLGQYGTYGWVILVSMLVWFLNVWYTTTPQ